MSLGKEPINVAAEESIILPAAGSVKDKPSEVSNDDTPSQQMVEQSEEETIQNLVEVGSIDEAPVDNIDIAVDNHESIIIPAIQPKEEKEEIPEILENWD